MKQWCLIYRHLDTQCHYRPHQGWSRWDSPGGSLSQCVNCWCFSWHGHDDGHWNHLMMFTWHWWPGGDSWGWSQSHWGWRWGRAGTHRWRCQSPPAWRRWCSVCSESCADSSRQPNLQNSKRFVYSKKNGIAHQNSHCKKFNLYNPLWGKQRALNTFHQYTFSQRHIFYTIAIALLLSLCFCNAIVLQ